MVITWKTRNIGSLFPLKDQNDYKSCIIYKGDCSCGSRYTGETKRNGEVRWQEHNNLAKSSESSKYLQSNIDLCFTCTDIPNTPKNVKTRKNLEASYINLWKLGLNEKRTLEDQFYLEMMSCRAINDIMQNPQKEMYFYHFSVSYCHRLLFAINV